MAPMSFMESPLRSKRPLTAGSTEAGLISGSAPTVQAFARRKRAESLCFFRYGSEQRRRKAAPSFMVQALAALRYRPSLRTQAAGPGGAVQAGPDSLIMVKSVYRDSYAVKKAFPGSFVRPPVAFQHPGVHFSGAYMVMAYCFFRTCSITSSRCGPGINLAVLYVRESPVLRTSLLSAGLPSCM